MKLFYKFSAALMAAALTAAFLLSGIFFSFQKRTIQAAQRQRLEAITAAARGMLREAELASDPLMAVDYLSGLSAARGEIADCELDIGRGMSAVKPRGSGARPPPAGPPKTVPAEIKAGKFSARINFSEDFLEHERGAALSGIYRDLAAAFLGATAAAGLLGLALAWHLTGRLKRLAAEAAAVGEGRFGVKAEVRGSDEVAELAGAFNRMSARLLELETMKKNFTAAVTHELRSPLGVIETYAAMLLKEEGRFLEEDRSVFRRIRENAARLANFVTAMLDIARIERGKMEVRPALENPFALARDAADFLRPKAEEKGITLKVETPPDEVSAMLDRELLTHALTNLIANAIKFTPEGGRIAVRAAAAGSAYRIEVSDSGPGIGPEELKKLFLPFSQGTAAPGHGGTGLGLALAKAIVELHKGIIGCGPAPGEGALFWVEIPLRPVFPQ